MSELVAVAFDTEYRADEVLVSLNKLQKEHLIDLEDAVVVTCSEDGKLKIRQTYNLIAMGATGGGFWGLLIGLILLNPLLGALVGAGAGAISGALRDIGINDDFIKELSESLTPGSSALFVLVKKSTPDKVLPEFKGVRGRVLHTSLSKDDEQALQEVLRAHPEAAQAMKFSDDKNTKQRDSLVA